MGRSISKEVKKVKLQYRKIGGGTARLILDGRKKMAKPNERFWAYPEEIPVAFADTIILLEGQAAPKEKEQEKVEKIFKVRVRPKTEGDDKPEPTKKGKPGKWYNVVNKDTGKPMNPGALTNSQAKKLANSLNT